MLQYAKPHIPSLHSPKVPLFKDCEEAFIRYLVMKLKLHVYLQGEIVFHMGDVGHEMYFISKVVPTRPEYLCDADSAVVSLIVSSWDVSAGAWQKS